MRGLARFAQELVDSAYEDNQVILERARLEVDRPFSAPCFRNGTRLRAVLRERGGELFIENEGRMVGPLRPGAYFRLVPGKRAPAPAKTPGKGGSRIRFYLHNHGLARGTLRMARIALMMRPRPPRKRPNLKAEEGVTFFLTKRTASSAEIRCYDTGALYDFFINTEMDPHPPQVPGNYYGTEYFACNCANLWRLTGEGKYREAAELALAFSTRVYGGYRPARIVFEGTEFKYPAIVEAHRLLGKELPQGISYAVGEYGPVNVYALRVQNLALDGGRERELRRYLRRIRKNQTAEGLIKDNYPPFYEDAKDLTYHQYAAACLARAHASFPDDELLGILERAAAFSDRMLFGDGEVSYYGRGCNNIYHIASAIHIFSYLDALRPRAAYRRNVARLFGYLSRKRRWLPSALNEYGLRRMGWNHCETPYNMQTAYFLLNSRGPDGKGKRAGRRMGGRKGSSDFLPGSGFYRFRNGRYEIAVTNGGEQYSWANRRHGTGVAGIANLTVRDEPTTLCLDMLDNETPITDMPRIRVDGRFLPPMAFRMEAGKGFCRLRAKQRGMAIERTYRMRPGSLLCSTRISFPRRRGNRKIEITGAMNLPMKEGRSLRARIVRCAGLVPREDREGIVSNPKGKGMLRRFGGFAGRPDGKEMAIDVEIEL